MFAHMLQSKVVNDLYYYIRFLCDRYMVKWCNYHICLNSTISNEYSAYNIISLNACQSYNVSINAFTEYGPGGEEIIHAQTAIYCNF